jgi:hypothetical protein
VLALVVALVFAAPPAHATEARIAPRAAAPGRLAAAAAAKVATLSPPPRAFAQAQATPAPSDADSPRSFFRTPTGIAAIALMVAGAAYVAISIPNDNEKVHSPIR